MYTWSLLCHSMGEATLSTLTLEEMVQMGATFSVPDTSPDALWEARLGFFGAAGWALRNQPTKKANMSESSAGARHRPLLGLPIAAYETRCWKW
jgi:hypothetical protein